MRPKDQTQFSAKCDKNHIIVINFAYQGRTLTKKWEIKILNTTTNAENMKTFFGGQRETGGG